MIQRYARCGGDNGVTLKAIRQACGLPAIHPSANSSLGLETESSQDVSECSDQRVLAAAALHYSLQMVRTRQGVKFQDIAIGIWATLNLPANLRDKNQREDLG